MRFSLIHPTRSRPEKSEKTLMEWIGNALIPDSIEIIISVDSDDPKLEDYKDTYTDLLISDNKSSVEAINNAARMTKGDVIIVVSDDSSCPPYWDLILRNALQGCSDFLLRVNDGIQKRICTLPIMDRVYYNRFGYIYNPIYKHSFADTELTEVAYKLGRIIVRNDIVFKHLHPEVTKEPKDDLYLRNDATHDTGRKIFQERQKINFGL